MNETLTNFRKAVADSTDLQEKVKAGADLVALGKENGYEFSQEELTAGWKELQESDEGLTEFELDVVSGGNRQNMDSSSSIHPSEFFTPFLLSQQSVITRPLTSKSQSIFTGHGRTPSPLCDHECL